MQKTNSFLKIFDRSHTAIAWYLTLAASLTLTACSDFLEEKPKDYQTEDQAYHDAASIYRNAVGSLYSYFGGYQDSQGLQGTYPTASWHPLGNIYIKLSRLAIVL